jgi:hypothetical protein
MASADPREASRVAEDQSFGRSANERMRARAVAHRFDFNQRVPFQCECADRGCREIVMLSLVDYERIREFPNRFLLVAGHEAEDDTHERVIEAENGYAIVEKVGVAGIEATRLDPRNSWQDRLVNEYELTVVFRASDSEDAEEVRGMLEAVLKQLDHPVTVSGPARLSPPIDPDDN